MTLTIALVDENKNKKAVTDEEVPQELRNAVEKDNKNTKEKEEKEKEEKDMCKLKVLLHSEKKKIQVNRSKTLNEIMVGASLSLSMLFPHIVTGSIEGSFWTRKHW